MSHNTDPAPGGDATAGEIEARARAFEEGEGAAMRRLSDTANPYPEGSAKYCAWQGGYWGERSHRERVDILRAIVGEDLDRTVDYDPVAMVKALLAERDALRQLLREADRLLVSHHNATYQSEEVWMQGTCPICAETGKYPHNIFGRIEAALARGAGEPLVTPAALSVGDEVWVGNADGVHGTVVEARGGEAKVRDADGNAGWFDRAFLRVRRGAVERAAEEK